MFDPRASVTDIRLTKPDENTQAWLVGRERIAFDHRHIMSDVRRGQIRGHGKHVPATIVRCEKGKYRTDLPDDAVEVILEFDFESECFNGE